MGFIARRLERRKAELAERRFKKRHPHYGVYFPLQEDNHLLRRSTHTRVAQYLSLEDIKTVVRYTSHYIPLQRGYTGIMCNENMPGWYGMHARQALNSAGVVFMEGPTTCYEERLVGVVLLPDGSVLKDFGDLTHESKTNHKEFRITGNPAFKPFDYVVSKESCVLIHVPHGSDVLPAMSAWGIRESGGVWNINTDEQDSGVKLSCGDGCIELVRELREADLSNVSLFAARFSRIWLDVEHFLSPDKGETDVADTHAGSGCAPDGRTPGWRWTDKAREEVLGHHKNYHEELKRVALGVSSRHGVCVIVDLHSYDEEPSPCEPKRNDGLADLFVGTGGDTTPPWLLDSVLASFDGVCNIELSTTFSSAYLADDMDTDTSCVVSVALKFRKDVLNDPVRKSEIRDALYRLANALNERCKNSTKEQKVDDSSGDHSRAKMSNTGPQSANLVGVDLEEADLSGADLSGVDLTGANLTGANLTGADLTGADLSEADLEGACLEDAKLSKATLADAEMMEANLTGADLSEADLRSVLLNTADLVGVNLSGTNLEGAGLYGADLSGANMSNANLECAYLIGVNLTGANLTGANLTGANLTGANLTGANLTGANLTGANLDDVDMTGEAFARIRSIKHLLEEDGYEWDELEYGDGEETYAPNDQ